MKGGGSIPAYFFVNNLSVGYGQNLSSVLSNSFSGVYLSMATVMCVRSDTGALKCQVRAGVLTLRVDLRLG